MTITTKDLGELKYAYNSVRSHYQSYWDHLYQVFGNDPNDPSEYNPAITNDPTLIEFRKILDSSEKKYLDAVAQYVSENKVSAPVAAPSGDSQ